MGQNLDAITVIIAESGFDPKLEGFSYRQLKKLESDEAVQKMKEE